MRDYVKGIIHAARMVGIKTEVGGKLLKEASAIHVQNAQYEFERAVHQVEDKRNLNDMAA